MQEGAAVIHDEPDTEAMADAKRNLVHRLQAYDGDVDVVFKKVDLVAEGEYITPKQQHAQTELHTCITYWDEDERMVVITTTQVPFHVRQIIAPLIGLPVKQIRVIKPRMGGGFGGKQDMLAEDLCSMLTIKTGRPVRLDFTPAGVHQRSYPARDYVHYNAGVKGDELVALDLYVIADTGAYGTHGLTVPMAGGFKGLTLYNPPNSRLMCDVVYTNCAPAGAFRGYGSMQSSLVWKC